MRVHVEDGRIVKIEGDGGSRVGQGKLTPFARRYIERIYSEDRILTPLRRKGDAGDGEFEPISWDDAIGEITGALKRIQSEQDPARAALLRGPRARRRDGPVRHAVPVLFRRLLQRLRRPVPRGRDGSHAPDVRLAAAPPARGLHRVADADHLGQEPRGDKPAPDAVPAEGEVARRQAGLHRPAPHTRPPRSATCTSRRAPAPTDSSRTRSGTS